MHGGSGTSRTGPTGAVQPNVLSLPARWKGNQPAGAGLSNLGNSCYLNSTLQCLAYVPPLAHLCLGHAHSSSCPRASSASSGNRAGDSSLGPAALPPCTFCIIERQLAVQLRGSRNLAVSPTEVLRNLNLFSRSFVRGRQEDSHELLTAVLDVMERDGRRAAVALGAPKGCRTIVEDLFLGRWQSQVRCLQCGHESNTYEPFATLPLDIVQARSVTEGLRAFTEAERLDGNNKYLCDKCRKLVPAMKQTTIWDEPNVLVLQLKRFNAGAFLGKITRQVAFTETVDLQPFMTPPAARRRRAEQQAAGTVNGHDRHHHHHNGQEAHLNGHGNSSLNDRQSQLQHSFVEPEAADSGPCLYTLTGVLVHQGVSLHSGHYYAFVRDSYGAWSCMNDSQVYGTSLDQVRQEQAYLLFYTRQNMKLPRLTPAPLTPPVAMDEGPAPPARAAAGSAPAGKLLPAATSGPARQFYGPKLPPNMVRGSDGKGYTAQLGVARESPMLLQPSRLSLLTKPPSARLPAKVVITPKASVGTLAGATNVGANTVAVGSTTVGRGVVVAGAAAVATSSAKGSVDRAMSPTGGASTTANAIAEPAQVARGSSRDSSIAPVSRGSLELHKRKRQSEGGVPEEAAAAAVPAAMGDGAGGSAGEIAAACAGEETIHARVNKEVDGLKACAFYRKGIKRLRLSVEEQLRRSSVIAAIREAVLSMQHGGMSLEQVLGLGHGDPRRKAIHRAVPASVLQLGMEELRKLLKPLLPSAGSVEGTATESLQ